MEFIFLKDEYSVYLKRFYIQLDFLKDNSFFFFILNLSFEKMSSLFETIVTLENIKTLKQCSFKFIFCGSQG